MIFIFTRGTSCRELSPPDPQERMPQQRAEVHPKDLERLEPSLFEIGMA